MADRVALIDYGSGNLHSAAKAFERAARESGHSGPIVVTSDPDAVRLQDARGGIHQTRRAVASTQKILTALVKTTRELALARTHAFFEKYGGKTIILARFVPIVRTFITAIAGVARMDFRRFMLFTAIGGVIWAVGVTLAGYFLGTIPFVKDNIEAILLLVVLVSVIPIVIEFIKHRRQRGTAAA